MKAATGEMIAVFKRTEFTLHLSGDSLSAGRLLAIVGSCGADVMIARPNPDGHDSVARLITDDEAITRRALEAEGFSCESNPVVLVGLPNKPGLTALLGAKLLAAGIEVFYSYTFRCEYDQAYAVFRTGDDRRAFYLLEIDTLIHDLAAAKSWHPPSREEDCRVHSYREAA